jgi:hypothetical protein
VEKEEGKQEGKKDEDEDEDVDEDVDEDGTLDDDDDDDVVELFSSLGEDRERQEKTDEHQLLLLFVASVLES